MNGDAADGGNGGDVQVHGGKAAGRSVRDDGGDNIQGGDSDVGQCRSIVLQSGSSTQRATSSIDIVISNSGECDPIQKTGEAVKDGITIGVGAGDTGNGGALMLKAGDTRANCKVGNIVTIAGGTGSSTHTMDRGDGGHQAKGPDSCTNSGNVELTGGVAFAGTHIHTLLILCTRVLILYSYTMYSYCTHTESYPYSTHTEYSCCTHTVYSYSTHTLYSYSVLILCTHTVYSYPDTLEMQRAGNVTSFLLPKW
jgi:hypothetical protein